MAKIVVIGASGMLGYDLMRAVPKGDAVIGLGHEDIEITDPESVRRALGRVRPDVIVNTAAFTKTEVCETDPELAFRVNSVGAYHVAKVAHELGATIVFISTDFVFDGSKQSFSESDSPNPLNIYGASKLAGEQLTRIANPRHYIVRTSSLFGKNVSHKGYNFVTLMLKLAREGQEIKVVNDITSSPTYTLDLAAKVHELIKKEPPFGIYHITSSGSATWYEFAQDIFRQADLTPRLIPITAAESPSKIRRPTHSILENTKFQSLGILLLRPWQEALRAYLDEIR